MAHSGNAIGSQQHIEDLKNEAESLQKIIQVCICFHLSVDE